MRRSQTALGIFAIIVLAGGSFAFGYFIQSNANGTQEGTGTFLQPSEILDEAPGHDRTRDQDKQVRLSITELSDPDLFDSRIARTTTLVESLQNSNANRLLMLLSQSKSMQPSSWRKEVQSAIIQRLAVLDPIVASREVSEFSEERQLDLLPLVYEEWALSDLDQAIDNAQDLDDEMKRRVTHYLVQSRADMSADQRREIARRLGREWVAIHFLNRYSSQQPFRDPKQELESFLSQSPSDLDSLSAAQSELLVQIMSAWIIQDGIGALEEIQEKLPKGYLKQSGRIYGVSREIGMNNPGLALEFAVAIGSLGMAGVASQTVQNWAKSDPAAAFNAVSSLEGRSARRFLHSQVLQIWASNSPYELPDATRAMPKHAQSIGLEKALSAIARTAPQSAVKLLDTIEDSDTRERAIVGILKSWIQLDVDGALEWMEDEPTISRFRDDLSQSLLLSLATSHPQLSLKALLRLPTDTHGVGPERRLFTWLAKWDLDTAIHSLPQARDGTTRTYAYGAVIESLLDDHNDFRQAMDLFLQLAKSMELQGHNPALHSLVFNAPMQLYDSLDEISSEEVKKLAARHLLVHESKGLFSDEQIAHLREVSGLVPRKPTSPEVEEAMRELSEVLMETRD